MEMRIATMSDRTQSLCARAEAIAHRVTNGRVGYKLCQCFGALDPRRSCWLCTNLRVKLGAKSQFEAVMAATRLGILVQGEQRLD